MRGELLTVAAAGLLLSASASELRVSSLGWKAEDSTEFLQKALDSGAETVIVDKAKGPWVTRPLFARSNQRIVFEKGVELVAKKGEFKDCNDCLFTCRGVSNVTISGYGALWRMHRADYAAAPYKKGEWRHSLVVSGSEKVTVEGLTLLESGGDGVYVGTNAGYKQLAKPSTDIVLRDLVCDRHYRQGISVISAKRLLIERCVMKNTFGTPPAAGIDFEPNLAGEELTDCVMRDCTLVNNQGNGIELCFMMLDGSGPDLSLTIENCRTHGNYRSVAFSTWNKPTFPKGFVKFDGCMFSDARDYALYIQRKPLDAFSLGFRGCRFVNAHTAALDATKATDIGIFSRYWNDATTDGIAFDDCTVRQPVEREWMTTTTPGLLGEQVKAITGTMTVKSPTGERKFTLDRKWMGGHFSQVVEGGVPAYRPFDGKVASDCVPAALSAEMKPLAPMNIRHVAVYRFYAPAAGEVRLAGRQMLLGRKVPSGDPMIVRDAAGKELAKFPIFPEKGSEVVFAASGAGFYTLEVKVPANAVRLTAANVPVAMEVAEAKPLNLISSAGRVRFRKAAGERGVLIFKGDAPERVHAIGSDPDGKVVWDRDGIAEETGFVVESAAKDGIWTLEMKPPSGAPFEDCTVLMRGVSPELFLSDSVW